MILHIDMDAFFASVEERDNPSLKGRPLVVGSRPEERGVVAAANYPARAFGVYSAMPMSRAVKLCTDLIIVPPRGNIYRHVSGQIHAILQQYTAQIESLSLDEAFLDVGASERLFGSTETIARGIKQEILDQLGLVASIGIGPNKFLAKLANDQGKPDGFTVIRSQEVQGFLDSLPVERIWGVGKVAQGRLHAAGLVTVRDLRKTSQGWLEKQFGKSGFRLWELCHGIDHRPVVTDSEAKSFSHETTFSTDIADLSVLMSVAASLTEGVCYRLRQAGHQARTVNLKVRFHDFSTVTRAYRLSFHTDSTLEIWRALRYQLERLLGDQTFSVRLVGVGVSHFSDHDSSIGDSQMDMFELSERSERQMQSSKNRQAILDRLTDDVRLRFGKKLLMRGRGL